MAGSEPIPNSSPSAGLELDLIALGASPAGDQLCTSILQAGIDRCAAARGGILRLPRGVYLCGGIQLRDRVVLEWEEGAVLRGSSDCRDYGAGSWNDALLTGTGIRNFALRGPGIIDGVDCQRPDGEEGFRGPHTLHLVDCSDFELHDLRVERAGNYAFRFDGCRQADLARLTILAGHDGLHPQACSDFTVSDCDIRTGDDAVAGCDNHRFRFVDCAFNSSCNGFRFGCDELVVEDCRFWGPGEYAHQSSRRTNMLAAFVHFAPSDRDPQYPSDRWTIRNVTVEHADTFYAYDVEAGLWQTGQPALRLAFSGIRASGLRQPISVLGDADQRFELTLEDAELALHPDAAAQPLIDLRRFGRLTLRRVLLQHAGGAALRCTDGQAVHLEQVTVRPDDAAPFALTGIQTVTGPSAGDQRAKV